ncbi:hypothetical protein Aph02nite_50090 [Actinoplanes philippinensis]|uniref:Uncharacterized protein n=1 Tax=Actinoplanes philippinensis TaxID=35752 RepID=A0A1I2IQ80_9ACTN|nr:hypothetical protein [Actinoplanes philippinensis]GIE79059.1 hypothetical protein Aph02nite_50090 [Actinoplanes philippinensis]SFF44562.1 hypothetical protein SAMN05421541_110354 [Actinoplanes philippinensis]
MASHDLSTGTAAEPAVYPMPAPGDDARFTVGLTIDVGKVLTEHGYPPIRSGADYVRLQSALFDFLYTLTPAGSTQLIPVADPGTPDRLPAVA